jgi:hypothetical protein
MLVISMDNSGTIVKENRMIKCKTDGWWSLDEDVFVDGQYKRLQNLEIPPTDSGIDSTFS